MALMASAVSCVRTGLLGRIANLRGEIPKEHNHFMTQTSELLEKDEILGMTKVNSGIGVDSIIDTDPLPDKSLSSRAPLWKEKRPLRYRARIWLRWSPYRY